MPRNKDEAPAVRVYTVCDESRYLIVKNVPALGCGDELLKLFGSYGDIEECKPMDAEECEPFTDVYWIKFSLISNARFAKRKLDEFVFLGNQLQVSYAPHFETLSDTKEKLEVRRKEVLSRINSGRSQGSKPQISNHLHSHVATHQSLLMKTDCSLQQLNTYQRGRAESSQSHHVEIPFTSRVSSNEVIHRMYLSHIAIIVFAGQLSYGHCRRPCQVLCVSSRHLCLPHVILQPINAGTSTHICNQSTLPLQQVVQPISVLLQQIFIASRCATFAVHLLFLQEYFSSPSMNEAVQLVREKLDKIQSSSDSIKAGPALKKARVDNRRRI